MQKVRPYLWLSLVIVAILGIGYLVNRRLTKQSYSFAVAGPNTSMNPIGKILREELQDDLGIELKLIDSSSSSLDNFRMVEDGKADFCLGSNIIYDSASVGARFNDVRTVLPLFELAMFVFHDTTVHPRSLADLVHGRKIGVGPSGTNSAKLILEVFSELDVDTSQLDIVYTPFEENRIGSSGIEVACFFTGLFNPQVKAVMEQGGVALYSIEQNPDVHEGSWVTSGICRKLWTNSKCTIPKNFYGSWPSAPVYTLSTQCCLYAHRDVSTHAVYGVIESIVTRKSRYVRRDPALLDIDPTFAGNYFYPLHDGVFQYLDRDEPSFLEREAEPLSLLVTVVSVFVSLVVFEGNRRRKKRMRLEAGLLEILEASLDPSPQSLAKLEALKTRTINRLRDGSLKYDHDLHSLITIFNQVEAEVVAVLAARALGNKDGDLKEGDSEEEKLDKGDSEVGKIDKA